MDYLIDSEWGLAVTIVALVIVLGIFGSALWFILRASDTNRRFRWLQFLDRRERKRRRDAREARADR